MCDFVGQNWLRQKHKVSCDLAFNMLKREIKSQRYCESLSVGLCQLLLHKQWKHRAFRRGYGKGRSEMIKYKAKRDLTLDKSSKKYSCFVVTERSLKGTFLINVNGCCFLLPSIKEFSVAFLSRCFKNPSKKNQWSWKNHQTLELCQNWNNFICNEFSGIFNKLFNSSACKYWIKGVERILPCKT